MEHDRLSVGREIYVSGLVIICATLVCLMAVAANLVEAALSSINDGMAEIHVARQYVSDKVKGKLTQLMSYPDLVAGTHSLREHFLSAICQ